MKKLIVMAALAVFGVSNVTAQEDEKTYGFDQGDVFLEGTFSYFSNKNNNEPVTTESGFNFTPKVGYFVSEEFAVGAQLGLSSFKDEIESQNQTFEEKLTGYNVGVFGRYYFLDLGERFKTYGELGVNYSGTNYDDGIDGTDDRKANGFGANLGLGLNYFVTERFAISFVLSDILSYNSAKADEEGAESRSSFNANLNVFNNFFATAQFGLLYKL